MEDYLEFAWISLDSLDQEKVQPVALKDELQKWLDEKKLFGLAKYNFEKLKRPTRFSGGPFFYTIVFLL